MKFMTTTALAALLGHGALAGGIDRSGQGIGTLFETGEVAEFSFGYVDPTVQGTLGASSSGDMADSYGLLSFGYKRPLNDKVDLAVILDQPFGANVAYPLSASSYLLRGTSAELSSYAVTALGRYHFNDRFSVHAGLRAQTMNGQVELWSGGVRAYTLDAQSDVAFGYSVGAAFEIPKIALRAALTYNSEITHTVDSTEQSVAQGQFDLTTPRSVNFDFQTGIAEGTLLTASARWVEWDGFDISPPNFTNLVAYTDNRTGYTLGVARRFSEAWAGSVTLGYEPAIGGTSSNLSPTDGYKSIAIGAQYTKGNMKVSGGLRYVALGDTITEGLGSDFSGNSALALGVKVSYAF